MQKSNITIENAQLRFRNFSGKEGKFNPAGRRNFCVLLDTRVAEDLQRDGWNVRWLDPRDPDDDKQAYMQVAVNFDNMPPKILLISSRGKTALDEEGVALLDWAEIKTVDVVIRPYNWNVSGKGGVKGYLKSLYVVIEEDEFEHKYYNVPDSAVDSIGGCGHCDACDGHCDK